MRWLCPATTNGSPGKETPATSNWPVLRCTSYQTLGMEWSRCMSFESSGLPLTVCAPETTHSLEPAKHESHEMDSEDWPARAVSHETRVLVLTSSRGKLVVPGRGWSLMLCVSGGGEVGGRSRHEVLG